jgi:hypothetical protein
MPKILEQIFCGDDKKATAKTRQIPRRGMTERKARATTKVKAGMPRSQNRDQGHPFL